MVVYQVSGGNKSIQPGTLKNSVKNYLLLSAFVSSKLISKFDWTLSLVYYRKNYFLRKFLTDDLTMRLGQSMSKRLSAVQWKVYTNYMTHFVTHLWLNFTHLQQLKFSYMCPWIKLSIFIKLYYFKFININQFRISSWKMKMSEKC